MCENKIEIKNKNILVVGDGVTGKGVCEFLKNNDCKYFLYDENKKIYFDKLKIIDYIVLSPGIQIEKTKIYEKIKKLNIKILSEIDFAFLNSNKNVVAVTGTNGKTTTVELINYILNQNQTKSVAVGNNGNSFSANLKNNYDFYVCECSSYQLEQCKYINPKISIFLNFSEDHLPRHKTIENYLNAKLNIFKNQTEKEYKIINCNLINQLKNKLNLNEKNIFYFSLTKKIKGCYLKNKIIYFKNEKKCEKIAKINNILLKGEKNLENILAGVLCAKLLNVPNKIIEYSINSFKPPKHRMEEFLTNKKIKFVNDSKATNIDSTICALDAYKREKIILLLGGQDKGQNFDKLNLKKYKNIKKIILFGQDKSNIFFALKKQKLNNKIEIKNTLKDATILAIKISKKGQTILLSPACASFDEFKNFEDRGEKFEKYCNEYLY